ncbi:MAG: hypothetical protein M0Z69_06955 [Actinomycetota bacterium]|nr:hypothetical protein [Actinomycetota bacterium]
MVRATVEDLEIKNMSAKGRGAAKAGLNRSIADVGWGTFLATLHWSEEGRQGGGGAPRPGHRPDVW